jgi:hypothetical protein
MKKVRDRLLTRTEKSIHVAIALDPGSGSVVAVETNHALGHAETTLIASLIRDGRSEKVDMVVVRVANTSRPEHIFFRNSKPCASCRNAILASGHIFNCVTYSTVTGNLARFDCTVPYCTTEIAV